MSALQEWGRHYFSCGTCQVHEDDPAYDTFCPEGRALRNAALHPAEREEDHAAERYLSRTEPCDHSQTITVCDYCLEHLGGAT